MIDIYLFSKNIFSRNIERFHRTAIIGLLNNIIIQNILIEAKSTSMFVITLIMVDSRHKHIHYYFITITVCHHYI